MIEELLPAEVASVARRIDGEPGELFPEEVAHLDKAIESRRREFAAGRACAREALAKLGLPPVPILRGEKREPLWPQGIVGSITHCGGYCAAAVAHSARFVTLGIDAEADEPLPEGVLRLVATDEDRAYLSEAPTGVHWDRLLFSAKESVYKAWFPLTGRWLGFEEASIRFDPAAGTFRAQLGVAPIELPDRVISGFDGRYLIRDAMLLTAIALIR